MSSSPSHLTASSAAVGAGALDPSPLLSSSNPSSGILNRRGSHGGRLGSALRAVARMLRRVGSRQVTGEPSGRVREAAAEQIEERRSDWVYSLPVVILDLVWNTLLVLVALVVLVVSRDETTSVPLRFWIVGYGIQSIFNMVFVCMEYKRRLQLRLANGLRRNSGSGPNLNGSANVRSPSSSLGERASLVGFVAPVQGEDEDDSSVANHLESPNTMFSFMWWIIGFYWLSSGGSTVVEDAPILYWLCVAFLALDVCFVVICVVVACFIGIAVCCCLPCIIAILYTVADQEGASKEDIEQLPRFVFRTSNQPQKHSSEVQESFGGMIFECDNDNPEGHILPAEDAQCAICLSAYEDGSELRQLQCRHLFHSACIDKWLYINAICPLCKDNILKNIEQIGPEQA